MKTSRLANILLPVLFVIFTSPIQSQDLDLYNMVGKKLSSVIKKYGKPLHQDRSNPEMECVFYKTKKSQRTFVSDREGIFQIEGIYCFNNRTTATQNINSVIKNCIKEGFTVDTLNASKFELFTKKIKVILTLFENSNSKEYEIRIKAIRSNSLN